MHTGVKLRYVNVRLIVAVSTNYTLVLIHLVAPKKGALYLKKGSPEHRILESHYEFSICMFYKPPLTRIPWVALAWEPFSN